jgi:hypothetical protein
VLVVERTETPSCPSSCLGPVAALTDITLMSRAEADPSAANRQVVASSEGRFYNCVCQRNRLEASLRPAVAGSGQPYYRKGQP